MRGGFTLQALLMLATTATTQLFTLLHGVTSGASLRIGGVITAAEYFVLVTYRELLSPTFSDVPQPWQHLRDPNQPQPRRIYGIHLDSWKKASVGRSSQ